MEEWSPTIHPQAFSGTGVSFFAFVFLKQGFSVDLEAVLELALVDQAGLELTEIHLLMPPECWN